MDSENKVINKLQNWSMEEDTNTEISEEIAISPKLDTDAPIDRQRREFVTQYLELSDDDDDTHDIDHDMGGLDTLGLEEDGDGDLFEACLPVTNDLERNPCDGLLYSSQYYDLYAQRQQLKIWRAKDDFVLSLDESPIVLVTGDAGSGKSTQIPQWCSHFARELNFEFGTVVCTQPHALAAISLAMQVSREMDLTSIGNEVGYTVPFSDVTSSETMLRFCTDEILLREMAEDPMLERYGIVIIDEVQERTVSTDILLSLLRIITNHRDTLKVVVISLPGEMPKLEEYFEGVPIVDLAFMEENENQSETENSSKENAAKLHPPTSNPEEPKIQYQRKNSLHNDFVSDAVDIIMKCHCDQKLEGNFLVFMPSEKEISEVIERVAREVAMRVLRDQAGELIAIPLHSQLPYGAQQTVYETNYSQITATKNENNLKRRKVIVCDKIAESSFTMDNISVVVDSGRQRTNTYNCRIRARSDFLAYISKQSADLRTKRCHRDGNVYRLYSESEYKKFDVLSLPAVARSELSTNVLLMKRLLQQLNVNFSSCQTLDPPAAGSYMQALEDLDYHGALDENGDLSDLGAVMSEFPLSLCLSKCVIASCGEMCTQEMLSIASMLVIPTFYLTQDGMQNKIKSRRKIFSNPAGDHFTLLNIYNAFISNDESESWCIENFLKYSSLKLATQVRADLVNVMERLELPMSPRIVDPAEMESCVKKAILAGFFMQIAKDVDGSGNYLIVRDRHVARLRDTSSLEDFPEWVVFNDFVLSDNSFILTVSSTTLKMVAEITPPSYQINLPDGESKELLLNIAKKLKDGIDIDSKNITNQDLTKSPCTSSSMSNTGTTRQQYNPTKSNYESRTSSDKEKNTVSKQRSQPFRYSGYTLRENATRRDVVPQISQIRTDDADILTQTARDLTYAYRQASSYVRNYVTEEEEEIEENTTCTIQ